MDFKLRYLSIKLSILSVLLIIFINRAYAGELAGTIEDNKYSPPSGLYKVLVPVDDHFGGKIEDSPNSVSFTDDFCHIFRIEFMPSDADTKILSDEGGKESFLKSAFDNIYMQLTIFKSIPNALIEHQEYIKEIFGGAYYAQVFLPKGSICSVSSNQPPFSEMAPFERVDGVRGILTFLQGQNIYFVSIGYNARDVSSPQDKEGDRDRLKKDTLSFAKTVQFEVSGKDKDECQVISEGYEKGEQLIVCRDKISYSHSLYNFMVAVPIAWNKVYTTERKPEELGEITSIAFGPKDKDALFHIMMMKSSDNIDNALKRQMTIASESSGFVLGAPAVDITIKGYPAKKFIYSNSASHKISVYIICKDNVTYVLSCSCNTPDSCSRYAQDFDLIINSVVLGVPEKLTPP